MNIALIEEGEPVVGVITAPALGVSYFAAKGQGAWKKLNGQLPERMVSRVADPAKPLRIVESRSHPSPALETFLGDYEISDRLRIGSSLKFCLLAERGRRRVSAVGANDGVGCGCRATASIGHSAEGTPHASPLTYNKPSLKNDAFVLGLAPGTYALPR